MKATGIVRRIDDLGRVVIPKEIRRTLRIREGDPLEIFTDREGEIILKKYSSIGELAAFAKEYAESLAVASGTTVCIADHDQVIATSGSGKKEFQEKFLSKQVERLLVERNTFLAAVGDKKSIPIYEGQEVIADNQVIAPILSEGDVIGAVMLLEKDTKRKFGETEEKLALCAAGFLGRQIEQ